MLVPYLNHTGIVPSGAPRSGVAPTRDGELTYPDGRTKIALGETIGSTLKEFYRQPQEGRHTFRAVAKPRRQPHEMKVRTSSAVQSPEAEDPSASAFLHCRLHRSRPVDPAARSLLADLHSTREDLDRFVLGR